MYLYEKKWSPVIVGAGVGLLTVAAFYSLGESLGMSSTFLLGAKQLLAFIHLQSIPLNGQDYEHLAAALGVVFGSYASSFLTNNFTRDFVPRIWRNAFGSSVLIRALGAFVGGVVLIFGARIAGGCTSGKAIASGMQLIVPAWIFIAGLFSAASITAFILYRNA